MTAKFALPAAPSADTIRAFTAIVGEKYALTDGNDQAPYLTEWRRLYQGKTPLILRPGSTEEVSRIMALASETGTAIVPQGGNTGLVGGQIPFDTEVVLSLQRMNRIRSVDPRGNVLIAEAGVTLAGVQKAAEEAGRLFPLSIGSEGSCQIGGNLATNAGGLQVLAYGNARNLVLGLEVVLPDGRVWDGLRALRKDNTGYDLRDLFIGSEGTLGIITAAVLRMLPQPKSKATAYAALPDLDAAARFFELANDLGAGELTAFELMPRIGIDFVLRHVEGTRDPMTAEHPWYALIELASQRPDEAQARAESLLMQGVEAGYVSDAVVAASLTQAGDFWRLREMLSEVQLYEGGSIKSDVSVPVAALPEFLARATEIVTKLVPGCRPVPFGHYGDGNIHYNVSQPEGADKAAFLARWDEVTHAINEVVLELGGSISAEHGIGRMKRDLLPEVKAPLEIELMRRIKSAFDPLGILNPGKLL
ncbi:MULTISPECIES: FAD-binding oxidoreductase [Rhodomicrobium]|uniref:FAD-binding oxidoreductase n=1 Tax=Rhodomicrobium TaxID=1068 RepID=UPI000B4B5711|nr:MULTISPECIES: FAD-binding oxidoreductase [Rhodomicrobium]